MPIQILYCLLESKGGLKRVFSDEFGHMYQRNCKNISTSPNHCNLPVVTVDNTKLRTSACHLARVVPMLRAQNVHNIMSVNSPLYCFQVQVGPVMIKGECTVGGCSDCCLSGCSYVTVQMDLQGVDKCWQLVLSSGFGPVHTDGVFMSCYVSVRVRIWVLNSAHRLLFLYGKSLRGNQRGWGECVWEREREIKVFFCKWLFN